jgi:hypothetical protein
MVNIARMPLWISPTEAGGPVVVHHAGGVAVDAHLFLDLAAGKRIAGAEAAIVVHEELRHDEKG